MASMLLGDPWKGQWCWTGKTKDGERDAVPNFEHGFLGYCAITVAIIVIIIIIVTRAEHLLVIFGIIGCIERCFGFLVASRLERGPVYTKRVTVKRRKGR